jgi:hypothetical protein
LVYSPSLRVCVAVVSRIGLLGRANGETPS